MRVQSTLNSYQFKNTANQMKETQKQQDKSSKELSTGKKVNTAGDDAAAMAITQQIMKEAKSLSAGSNNISYGIDAANIADSALANINDSLGDIEQNTVRAMNGLYSESDRAILQEANEQSVATINQTISQASYNEMNLLDGTAGDININTGTSSMSITETDAKAAMADLENFDVSASADSISTEALDGAYSSVSDMRSQIGAQTNGLSAAYNVNNSTEENLTAAQARKEDAEFEKSVSEYKNSAVVKEAQNQMLKNQMDSQENMVNKLFQQ
ncbi:MAG: hypothetical protein K6E79_02360 [Pseudobutyrivibrio sp.]|nr:hypothetical protein [Pseudobutyrivibrio sp.]